MMRFIFDMTVGLIVISGGAFLPSNRWWIPLMHWAIGAVLCSLACHKWIRGRREAALDEYVTALMKRISESGSFGFLDETTN